MNLTKFNEILDTIKNVAVALLGVIALSFVGFVLIKSFNTSELTFESIKVPESFVEAGYTSQITVTQILDEVAKIHEMPFAGNNENKKSIHSNKSSDNLSRLESIPGAGGIDYRSIQSIIQDTFGITKETLSGEITVRQNGDKLIYHVRVRLIPRNQLLVDFSSSSDIADLLKKIALSLIESLEPTIAASYYRYTNDLENAERVLDIAINDQNYSDDTNALAQKAALLTQQGKFILAQDYINRALSIDSKSPQALIVQSSLLNKQKNFLGGLEFAKKASEYWPDKWQPFFNMAIASEGLGLTIDADKNFMKSVSLGGNSISLYTDASNYFIGRSRPDLAEDALAKGIKTRPDSIQLLLTYSDLLIQKKDYERAEHYLRLASKINPKNLQLHSLITQLPNTQVPTPTAVNEEKSVQK